MSDSELDSMWAEIRSLRDELESLQTKRAVLIEHLSQLEELGTDLQQSHDKVEAMAKEVQGMIGEGKNA